MSKAGMNVAYELREGEGVHTVTHPYDIPAIIAHELRNPLAAMSNALSLCRRNIDPSTFVKTLELLSRQLQKVVRLVDDLTEISSHPGLTTLAVSAAPLAA